MKLFNPGNLQYLYDLACELGEITIEPDFIFDLVINPNENNRGARVHVDYDGEPIATYPFTKQGIAQGLSMLKISQRKSPEELRQMRTNYREGRR